MSIVADKWGPRGHNLGRLALWLSLVAFSGCADVSKPFSSQGHIEPPEPVAGTIPSTVPVSPFTSRPKEAMPTHLYSEVYSISVANMPVKDLLYALAKDANLNLDIHPEVKGRVTLNVIDQTLPRIMERIAAQVDIRFKEDGPSLVVTPDWPYIKTYSVNYLNVDRKAVSSLRLTSQITTSETIAASPEGGDSTPKGNSTVQVTNSSDNKFWVVLTDNILNILNMTRNKDTTASADRADPLMPISGDLPPENTDTVAGMNGGGSGDSGRIPPLATAAKPTPTPAATNDYKVTVNPQSGLITILASSKQHMVVQTFLDQIMAGARRQVRIEATIVEIRLNDQFQGGVDWTAFRDLSSNRPTTRTIQAGGAATTPTMVFEDENPVFNLSLYNAASGLNTLAGTVHNISAAVRLLHQFGDVQVLSTPKLVALNNQVSILKVVDNEVYFTVEKSEKNTNGTNVTTFTSEVHTVPIGVVMNVIPQISPNDEVSLIVRPTITRIIDFVTDPNPDLAREKVVSRVPKIQVREMESMLNVRSGQVAVIGGLMTNVSNTKNNRLPGLNEIPLLGALFKTKDDNFSKSELVIFLKPTVVHSDVDLMETREIDLLRGAGTKLTAQNK